MGPSEHTGVSPSKEVTAQRPLLPPLLPGPGVAALNLFGTGDRFFRRQFLHGVGCAGGMGHDGVDDRAWGGMGVG